ncbi:MAG: pyridoxal phosphate-dependent aminotransferase [Chloroflexi bacterium]|nr:pyridoxal phosphate-dependent aminotransferase [Chloroflexota bacterium]
MSGFLADADLGVNPIEAARLAHLAAGRSYVDLTSSNPTAHGLLFPPKILRDAAAGFWEKRRYLPDPHGALPARDAVAEYYATRRAPGAGPFDPEQIFLTASTSEAYGLLFALLTSPGDNVLAPRATYPLYEHFAAVHHVELRTYELDERRGWAIDEHSLLNAADERTRAVMLVSPHNPTGMVMRAPIPALDALGLPLICDEVFAEFTRTTPAPLIAALHPRLPCFTLNGISKLFALPDLKLGWVLMNPPAADRFSTRFEILNDAFLSANSLTQHMLPHLFAHGMPFVEHMRTHFRAGIDLGLHLLEPYAAIQVIPPDGGYYLFPRVHGWDDEDELVLHLLNAGVLVHPGYFYGLDAERDGAHLMISCLTNPEALESGAAKISDFRLSGCGESI